MNDTAKLKESVSVDSFPWWTWAEWKLKNMGKSINIREDNQWEMGDDNLHGKEKEVIQEVSFFQ